MGILGITDVNTLKHPMRYVRVLMIIATQSWCFGIKENGKGKTRNPIIKSLQIRSYHTFQRVVALQGNWRDVVIIILLLRSQGQRLLRSLADATRTIFLPRQFSPVPFTLCIDSSPLAEIPLEKLAFPIPGNQSPQNTTSMHMKHELADGVGA